MQPIEFLTGVWNVQCQEGDYVAVAAKGSEWRDAVFPFDAELPAKLERWMKNHTGESLYFCPLPFTIKRRSKAHVRGSRFLWADIDDADPNLVKPSILWESSPGRFQGLWRVAEWLDPESAAQQSRDLAYYIGADRGGWDLTQVLRIPGTRNYKYPDAPEVKLVHWTDRVLRSPPQRVLDRWRKTIPRKLLRIIEGPATVGKRSDMLWYLEHELCDLGIPLKDVISILRESDWNKYRGREDEDERFRTEMEKIAGDRDEKRMRTRVESVAFRVETFTDVMSAPHVGKQWMVEDYWLRGSHGIVAGEPKSFKSTLVMDMLYAVAAGQADFLGKPVHHSGPVLIVQNENSSWIIQERLGHMANNRNLAGSVSHNSKTVKITWGRQVPMLFVNQQGFSLDDAGMLDSLEELIARERPVAVNLDPLYLMFSGDVNSAKDLNPALNWLLRIKQEYDCSVILVHHYNKGGEGKRGGQRMLGSTTLHGWIESAWYIQAQEAVNGRAHLSLDREFRGAGIYEKQLITIGEKVDIQLGTPVDHTDEILSVLGHAETLAITDLVRATGLKRDEVQALVDRLVAEGSVKKEGQRYALVR